METNAKENILNRIRKALEKPVPLPFAAAEGNTNFFVKKNNDNIALFAEEFTKLQGQFTFCENYSNLQTQLLTLINTKNWAKVFCKEVVIQNLLENILIKNYTDLPSCDVSITTCENLVARTGTIVLTTANDSGRTTSVYAPIHICIAYTSQVLYDVTDALESIVEKYNNNFPSFITFASGPSRTADIEKTLVTGVHGPKEVYCFLVKD